MSDERIDGFWKRWRSRDHRNRNAPFLLVLQVSDNIVIAQRHKDRQMTQPHGKPVAVNRAAWKAPAYEVLR